MMMRKNSIFRFQKTLIAPFLFLVQQQMEFWGAEVKPGKPLMVTPDEDNIIHISQASDDEDDSEKGMEEVDEDDSDDDEESEEEEETPKKPEPINKKMPNESASKTSVSGKKAKQAAAPAATPQKTGSKSKVGDGGKYHGSNDLCRSILSEKLLQLLPYRPALHPTWKGRIVDSATPSEFNGEFLAQPASKVSRKAYRLSKAIPVSLKVKLVPIGNLLNDLFVNRNPGLSDVELYILPYDENTKRFTEERDHLFEAMRTRNAMIKIDINGTPLLLFSSKLLDKSSQIIMKMQKKTNNFLWGIFLLKEAQHFDGDVVDNDTEV